MSVLVFHRLHLAGQGCIYYPAGDARITARASRLL